MTEEELNEIRSHLTDHTQNWDVRLAQKDRLRLLAEVDHLRECMRQAGLTAFMKGRDPQEVGDHLRSVLQSYDDKITDLQEQGRHIPGFPLRGPGFTLPEQARWDVPPLGEPLMDYAVTGNTLRCDYRGALAECHSLYCPVHGVERDR